MKKVCNRFFAVIFLLSAMPCKLISQQDLNLSVEGILKLPKDTIVNGDMHFREKLNDVVLKNPEKKGVALVCPSSSALKVAGYIPSVVANNMASSIKISAKSPYGFEISGVLNFAHSRTFSRIKKELEGNIFLLEQSYFDYVEKTIHCVYQIGQNKIELKNQDVDITACPPLKNFTVHPGARYLSMDLFKKNGQEAFSKKIVFKQLANGTKTPFVVGTSNNDIMNNEALVNDISEDSYTISGNDGLIAYHYPLTLENFEASLLSKSTNVRDIQSTLKDYILTDMSQKVDENKHSTICCAYTNKKNGNIVTATIEIQEKGTYIEGKQIDCSVFVSEKNVPQ